MLYYKNKNKQERYKGMLKGVRVARNIRLMCQRYKNNRLFTKIREQDLSTNVLSDEVLVNGRAVGGGLATTSSGWKGEFKTFGASKDLLGVNRHLAGKVVNSLEMTNKGHEVLYPKSMEVKVEILYPKWYILMPCDKECKELGHETERVLRDIRGMKIGDILSREVGIYDSNNKDGKVDLEMYLIFDKVSEVLRKEVGNRNIRLIVRYKEFGKSWVEIRSDEVFGKVWLNGMKISKGAKYRTDSY